MEWIFGKESRVRVGFVSAGFPWAWKKFPSATFGIGISPLPSIRWMDPTRARGLKPGKSHSEIGEKLRKSLKK